MMNKIKQRFSHGETVITNRGDVGYIHEIFPDYYGECYYEVYFSSAKKSGYWNYPDKWLSPYYEENMECSNDVFELL